MSEKDNAIALMKRAWQAQSRDGEGGEKNSPPFPPDPPPLTSQSPLSSQFPPPPPFLPIPHPFGSTTPELAKQYKPGQQGYKLLSYI